jgi:hypothetical protein
MIILLLQLFSIDEAISRVFQSLVSGTIVNDAKRQFAKDFDSTRFKRKLVKLNHL